MKFRSLFAAMVLGAFGPAFAQSVCTGTPSNGSIRGAVRVPEAGENFEVYRWKGGANRLFVHSAVARALEEAYLLPLAEI